MTKPFGPIASMLHGNGLMRTYTYDSDYRLTDLVTGDVDTFVQDLTYRYDDADNILSIADAITSGRSQTFSYDNLFRLKTAAASGTYGSITYNYDEVGNRTSVVDGAGTESYSTDSASNRLLSATLGSTTHSFTYDGANRLSGVSVNSTADTDYLYNALGERVKKAPAATPTAGTRFHCDRDGRLIAETDSTGAVIREYAWLEGLPIGEATNASAGKPPGQIQIDNGDTGGSSSGSWSTATAGSG